MRKLILVKHARPLVAESMPARDWQLSEEGKNACAPLAAALAPLKPTAIVTSDEAKAIQTGALVGDSLDLTPSIFEGLGEHDRSNVPMMPSREFLSLLALFFQNPDRLVLGRETAAEAARRFEQAIAGILAQFPTGNAAVVTHGTVLALFAAAHGAGDPFSLYRKLGLPSLMVFSIPDLELVQSVERISA